MKLIFNQPHKSIGLFDPIDLPSFTVLTGVNGAGKSHLLEAIECDAVSVEGVAPNHPEKPKLIRKFDWNTLIPQDNGAFSAANHVGEQTQFWNEIVQNRLMVINELNRRMPPLGSKRLVYADVADLKKNIESDLSSASMTSVQVSQYLSQVDQLLSEAESQAEETFVRADPVNRRRLLEALKQQKPDFSVLTIDQETFYRIYPSRWQPVDLFQQSFARLFATYQHNWNKNQLKQRGRERGAEVDALTDQAFYEKYGQPPWQFLNDIFKAAELDFEINAPYEWDERPYEPILTDTKRGTQVRFNDLSSGERVLMSFALCLYHAADQSTAIDFPKVLLFDEIDAPLHPSMSRSLLRTIQKTLVEEHGIFVILTTHSPSTVALAPDASIYVMQKQGPNRVVATSKDQALGVLTAGVPTLSVNYENNRQVFVESKWDVQYYSALYKLCKPKLLPEVSVMFIPAAAYGNGNCDQVKAFVDKLTEGGVRTVLCVVDWDRENVETHPVLVLGEGERYSIENFLLDPLLIGGLLLRECFETPESLGIDPAIKYVDMRGFTQEKLQVLADAVVSRLTAPSGATPDSSTFEYVSGVCINVPTWFAHMQGHALEAAYKQAYPKLLRYKNEPDLKNAVLSLVLGDYPGLVPVPILRLFDKVQRAG